MLFATECPVCDRPSPRGALCARCAATFPLPPPAAVPPGLDACRAFTSYEATGRALVTRLKFRNRRGIVPYAAAQLARRVSADGIEVVTWAPTARARVRRRGFDQAELLARCLARELDVVSCRCLVRLPGPAQTGRHRDERLRGPRFDACRGIVRAVAGRRVALVDDVATTGATLTRAAEVLRSAGARAVVGVVIARTPAGAGPGHGRVPTARSGGGAC